MNDSWTATMNIKMKGYYDDYNRAAIIYVQFERMVLKYLIKIK